MSLFISWIFLILFGTSGVLNAAPLSDSVLSHSVLLTFSNVSLDTWLNKGKNLTMVEVLANISTDYCKKHADDCGISSATSTRFKSENVKTANSYPKSSNNNLEILVYVEIPTNGPTTSNIPGSTLLTIVTNAKLNLSLEIGYDVKSIVSASTLSAGSDGKELDNKLNRIMIPVALLLLLVIALIAWILHRGNKKRQAREQRERYTALQNNSKKKSDLRESDGSMANTADVPPTQFSGQTESGMPDLAPPEDQAEYEYEPNNNIRRHRKRRVLPKRPPSKRVVTDESDDVFDDDTDRGEKPKKRGRRRKGRRSYDVNRDGSVGDDYEMRAAKEVACSQASSEGTNGESQVNTGYQRDSEKGESDQARMSNTDSAVELSSSVSSSANHNRARSLPPISRTNQKDAV